MSLLIPPYEPFVSASVDEFPLMLVAEGAALAKGSDNDVAFVVGTGTDVKLSDRFSIGMEGLFYGFEEDKVTLFANGNRIGSLNTDNDFYVVRARLTYHLH